MSVRTRTVAFLIAIVLASPVAAQELGTVSVDDVRVTADGRHVVTVSALDAAGDPVPGLDRDFRVTLDGTPVENLSAVPARTAMPASTITLILDGALLEGSSLGAVQDAVRELARGMHANDRLRVTVAGSHVRSREASATGVGRLADGLGDLRDSNTPVLYDALFSAARTASRLPSGRGAAILLVTRGADAGSRHAVLEVLAMAHSPERRTPVMVVLLGDQGATIEADRLRRLATHTTGALVGASSTYGLGTTLRSLADRVLERWVLRFTAHGWDERQEKHHLSLLVEHAGQRRTAEEDYETSDALAPPWWRAPVLWISLAAFAALALLAFLLTRRRVPALLVHDGDEQDGFWYELYAFPIRIGATDGNDLVLFDPQVSRNHAVFEKRGRNVELVDLNSENGTFVNGERVQRRVLSDGDRVSIGESVHLIFEARG